MMMMMMRCIFWGVSGKGGGGGGGVVLILHSHSPFSQQRSVISTPFHFLPQYRIPC